jgi:hypothetical protein
MVYLIVSRPYEEKKLNIIEIFNEGTMLIVACMLFVFTDLVKSVAIKDKMGKSKFDDICL